MVNDVLKYKQTVILRADLKMSVGKMISQACHACLESSEIARAKYWRSWKNWRKEGAKKVILKVDSLKDLLELKRKAARLRLPCYLVKDRGLTEIPPGTITALAIGPALADLVNRITVDLELL